MKQFLFTILLSECLLHATAQKFTISGYVKDASSGENLIGIHIFDKHTLAGTSSNYYGFYSLTLLSKSNLCRPCWEK